MKRALSVLFAAVVVGSLALSLTGCEGQKQVDQAQINLKQQKKDK